MEFENNLGPHSLPGRLDCRVHALGAAQRVLRRHREERSLTEIDGERGAFISI